MQEQRKSNPGEVTEPAGAAKGRVGRTQGYWYDAGSKSPEVVG